MTSVLSGQKSVVIIGSFGKHMAEIVKTARVFDRHGYKVLSPPGITEGLTEIVPATDDDFLVLEGDDAIDPKTLQDRVIKKMRKANLVYWVNPEGYVGESAAWEFGNANSLCREDGTAVPVYALHKPKNATFALYLEGRIYDPETLCQNLAEQAVDGAISSAGHLFFDIDDTLIDDQGSFQMAEYSMEAVLPGFRSAFIETERFNIPDSEHSYGLDNMSYVASFVEAYMMLDPELRLETHFKKVVSELLKQRRGKLPLLHGVDNTLARLQGNNYGLHVISRGSRREQVEKLISPGIHKYFSSLHFMPAKGVETYLSIASELGLSAAECCMIGNSIRYDIKPALSAGWGAVHIIPPLQWELENEEMTSDSSRFRIARSFSDLADLFDGRNFI